MTTTEKDQATIAYFDKNVPEYSPERLRHLIATIKQFEKPQSSLADIGCGTGNVLATIKQSTSLKKLWGMDVSRMCLDKTKERVGCETLEGSILDDIFAKHSENKFDFVLVSAVLHHLIGKTRTESKHFARQAIANAMRITAPGGRLLILEPIFEPEMMMDAVFCVKKFVTKFTSERVGIGGYWNNIGAPIVSYYNFDELLGMIRTVPSAEVERTFIDERARSVMFRAAGISKAASASIVIRKREASRLT